MKKLVTEGPVIYKDGRPLFAWIRVGKNLIFFAPPEHFKELKLHNGDLDLSSPGIKYYYKKLWRTK